MTDLAGNPLAADSTWSFSVEASPPPILIVGSTGNQFGSYVGEILRNEGLQAFTTIDVAFVSPALLAQFDVVDPRRHATEPGPGDDAHRLGERGRQPRRDAPRQAAREPARTDGRGNDARERVPPGGHGHRAGRRHRRQHDPVPRHRRPLHAERRYLGRDALLECDDRDDEPRRDAALGRLERRPGSRVHLRPRALGRLHAPGQSRLGGTGTRRRHRASVPTTSSTAPRPATYSPTGSTRTRSRFRRPTSSSGCS